jgi:pimeloyl-ACP methyl ester carboxylesterase
MANSNNLLLKPTDILPELEVAPKFDDDQFLDNPHESVIGTAEIAGTTVEYLLEVPENPVSETVNVLVYGFAGSEPAYRGLAHAISDDGYITLRCRLPRNQSLPATMHPKHLFKPTAISSKSVLGAIKKLPEHGLPKKANLFGHSLGGWVATELAIHKPDVVDNLVLLSSAGLIEHSPSYFVPKLPRFIGKTAIDIIKQKPFSTSLTDVKDALGHIMINPVLTAREAIAVAHCDIRKRLDLLNPNVHLAILQLEEDEFFDSVEVASEVAGKTDNFRIIPDLGHSAPVTHPKETAQAYIKLLKDKVQ